MGGRTKRDVGLDRFRGGHPTGRHGNKADTGAERSKGTKKPIQREGRKKEEGVRRTKQSRVKQRSMWKE